MRATLRVYRERQEALTAAIQESGRGLLETSPRRTGMYLVAWLRAGIDDRAAARMAAKHGVEAIPLSTFCVRPLPRKGLVLGYSAYEPNRIRTSVKQLCEALSHVR